MSEKLEEVFPTREQAAENVCVALLDFWGGDDFADEPPGIEVYDLWLQWRTAWETCGGMVGK